MSTEFCFFLYNDPDDPRSETQIQEFHRMVEEVKRKSKDKDFRVRGLVVDGKDPREAAKVVSEGPRADRFGKHPKRDAKGRYVLDLQPFNLKDNK